ncbi:hypothetical protein FHS29_007281 [Saccharothrix tamanrassetensis]|uniref:Uncharacterized protein n=1 Tax=Saccharothrix tamanrassetensis TaxID=1051531 RepID=A0A841CV05_9PSEU|nr:hypothetical protein [Saccharothrix tamanrassetensis]MBB5960653.1 hypothetical protein [Saccharothrix tamanrassetensis]
MTVYDEALDDFAERVDRLPRRAVAALFAACAAALVPEYRRWAAHVGASAEPLADRVLAAARGYATTGTAPSGVDTLLAEVEEATPPGESPDDYPSTAAQDCWICVDLAIRVIADPDHEPGTGIEYALEPIVQKATERVHGVTEVGSGPDEDAQVAAVLAEPDVAAALDFVTWATGHLAGRPDPTDADLAELDRRAGVLAP